MSKSTEQPKATLFSDWKPAKTVIDSERGSDEFMIHMNKIHQKSSDGNKSLILQMPWTKNEQGGISGTHFKGEPKIGHENQGKCTYYKRNFVTSNKDDMTALKGFKELDEIMASKEVKKKLFGKEAGTHVYLAMVRKTQAPKLKKGETARTNEVYFHVKIKIKTKYISPADAKANSKKAKDDKKNSKKSKKSSKDSDEESGSDNEGGGSDKDKDVDFISDRNFTPENPEVLTIIRMPPVDKKGVVGKGYVKQDVKTIPELRKLMRRNCEYRDTVHIMHVWTKKSPLSTGQTEYGVSIKSQVIDIRPGVGGGGNSVDENCVVSENEADTADEASEADTKKKASSPSKDGKGKKAPVVSDDDGEASENSDSESEKPSKKSPLKAPKKVSKDSENSDDEASEKASDNSDAGSDSEADTNKKSSKASKKVSKDSDASEEPEASGSDSDSDTDTKKKGKSSKTLSPKKTPSKPMKVSKDSEGSGSESGAEASDAGSDSEADTKKKSKAPAKKASKDSDEEASEAEASDAEASEEEVSPPKKSSKKVSAPPAKAGKKGK